MTVEIEMQEKKKRGRPKKVKAEQMKGAVGKGEAEDVALKAIENLIKKYTAGTAYNLIIEYITIGEEIRMRYEDIAYQLGFDSVKEFIEHAVEFYLNWSDKVEQLLNEIDNLKAENVLLKTIASKEFKELVKTQLKRELMLYSLAFNVNPLLVKLWKEEIESMFNDELRREEISSDISNLEYSNRELEKSERDTSDENSNNTNSSRKRRSKKASNSSTQEES